MPSRYSGSTHAWKTSGVACLHHPWIAHIERRHREWHVMIALGQHPRLDNVRRGMIAWYLRNAHGRTRMIVTCYHHHWRTNTIRVRRAWHDIISLGHHTWSKGVEHGMPSSPLDNTQGHTISGEACHLHHSTTCTVRPPRAHATWALCSINGWTMSGVTCHHRPWAAHTVGFFRARHGRMVLGQYIWTKLIVAWHYHTWAAHFIG